MKIKIRGRYNILASDNFLDQLIMFIDYINLYIFVDLCHFLCYNIIVVYTDHKY